MSTLSLSSSLRLAAVWLPNVFIVTRSASRDGSATLAQHGRCISRTFDDGPRHDRSTKTSSTRAWADISPAMHKFGS